MTSVLRPSLNFWLWGPVGLRLSRKHGDLILIKKPRNSYWSHMYHMSRASKEQFGPSLYLPQNIKLSQQWYRWGFAQYFVIPPYIQVKNPFSRNTEKWDQRMAPDVCLPFSGSFSSWQSWFLTLVPHNKIRWNKNFRLVTCSSDINLKIDLIWYHEKENTLPVFPMILVPYQEFLFLVHQDQTECC